jgi:hypothetical protein
VSDHHRVTCSIRPDADRGRAALLTGDLIRPRSIGRFLRSVQHRLEVSIAFASAEVWARPLDLPADALHEGAPLGTIGKKGSDPSGSF